ncbi:MAG: DUF362 domain-containing protein [Desulfofustis sp.]|nr:DUF362 domain-containing protein [Desulfofustis sp.]
MNRRRFLKQVALYSGGLSLSLPLFRIPESLALDMPVPDVAQVTGSDYTALVKKTMDLLGSMGSFVKPGDKVVVKPNIGWDRSPEQGANTHPEVVSALVVLALDAGADQVQVFDYTCNEKRRCYNNSGMTDAIKSIGSKKARLVHVDQRKFVPVKIAKGQSLKQWDFYKDALTADCYINVPVAKHHGLSRLSLGLKNSMGVIGGRRGALHHDLGQNLADLATVLRPQLTIVDATRILTDNGPQGGSLKDVKVLDTLLGSVDPVAADAMATALFGLAPEDISSTVAAHRMGLGQMDPARINLLSGSV